MTTIATVPAVLLSVTVCWYPGLAGLFSGIVTISAGAALLALIVCEISLHAGADVHGQYKVGSDFRRQYRFIPSIRRVDNLAGLLAITILAQLTGLAAIHSALSRLATTSFSAEVYGLTAIYYTVVTFATVGYGDIYPESDLARLVVSFQILASFFMVVIVVASTVSWAMANERVKDEEFVRRQQAEVDRTEAILREARLGVYSDESARELYAKLIDEQNEAQLGPPSGREDDRGV
ncbi:MAG: potassium channel family protein [Phycisphaerae bacterium]